MKKYQLSFVALICATFLLSASNPVQADWGISNPFSWGSTKKTTKKKAPSTLSKMGTSTKDFFYKTGDFLNPFNDGKETSRPSLRKMPSLPQLPSSRSKPKAEKKSSWTSWLYPAEEPQAPRTVEEFMRLERSKF
ncbi:MAG: hypothetical protein COA78_23595 [Blastopirellula sp.]|nr:MAG: hypothetical protein COA78_23595 [Blastopirellula sp.]